MVSTDQLLDIIPAISVAIALIYYSINVRNANKSQQIAIESRNAQFFITLYNSMVGKIWSRKQHRTLCKMAKSPNSL